jgi:hypothetical protein
VTLGHYHSLYLQKNDLVLSKKREGKMNKAVMLSLAFLVVAGLMLTPVISSAVPGNGNGNAGGNGNHYGWDKGNGSINGGTYDTPEPSTLLQLVPALIGLVGWGVTRKRMRKGSSLHS